jgi:hypothetical protein
MRPTPWLCAEPYRIQPLGYESRYGDSWGTFQIRYAKTNVSLRVLAVDGNDTGWEHVSVSLPNRCPNWPEMDFVKDMFWLETECVMQLHVPKADHRCLHNFCLHLWRPTKLAIPRPSAEFVA